MSRQVLLPSTVEFSNVPELLLQGGLMPFQKPTTEDVQLMQYMRDQGSALDRDDVLLQWLATEAEARKKRERALEEHGRACEAESGRCGVGYAMQLIREYGALHGGKVKR